ncbi:citrate lyase subunit alpha [Mariniplasma anaerobium]|uniref:Citrate lyase alpha chain n=1 Tax=Mariniplasma anaerobium TaxID=2735436 RepID=A0A7U9THE0_9MOLU|nr:citrate lyase subunit alpha [Mariniplasma anaerobium]BCR35272.1 citrate lyase subunit alpha [Mariniplasma anaerobium]
MIKNSLGKMIPDGYKPFISVDHFKTESYNPLDKILSKEKCKRIESISLLFDELKIKDGMTFSFHHHYRNGDLLLNMVLKEIKIRNLKNITLAPSSIFPIHEPLVDLIKNQNVTSIFTNYVNGPVADAISHGYLKDLLIMDTHGGRARAIESGDIKIDVAFIAASAADLDGNANGIDGNNPCGPLGYIYPDLYYAKHKVIVTDTILDKLSKNEINHTYVDYLIKVDQIGLSSGIESGTTSMTKDPVQLKIAKDTVKLMNELDVIKNNMSFQTGAGTTSIAVAAYLKDEMIKHNIKGSFASGGITSSLVDMYNHKLFDKLYDVQSFDLTAVNSYKNNINHILMDASQYANPFYKDAIVNKLDCVVLGATEIDLNYNVNVTTTSTHQLIGGSGGHSDTAYGSKLTIITTNLVKSRIPSIRNTIQVISTPGNSVDVIVTERGISVNPNRNDLLDKLKNTQLKILTIDELYQKAIEIAGLPELFKHKERVIGLVRYRDGSILDSIYEV